MWAKRWLWLVLGAPALVACPGSREPAGPNGKRGVLFFVPEARGLPGEASPVAEGLKSDLLLPGSLTSLSGRHHLTFDFEGTSLEVEADAGVRVVDTRRWGRSWRFTYRCEASEPATHEVRVRVRAPDGAERYADAYDVLCRRPLELDTGHVVGPPASADAQGFRRFLTGTRLHTALWLFNRSDPRNPFALGGRGELTVEDPGVVRRVEGSGPLETTEPLFLETVGPGRGPRLRFAGLGGVLPIEVVPDTALTLALRVDGLPAEPDAWVRGAAVAQDGGEVGGLRDCSVELRPNAGPPSVRRVEDCVVRIPSGAGAGTVCVSARGHTVCTEYRR